MLEKCILIARGKWSGSIFRGGEEKMERMRERETRKGRVHHRSVVAGFNQLLTPCRLAAVPTNDAMMAVSFPRTAAYLGEWWSRRKRQREKQRRGEQWWEMNWKKKRKKSWSKLVMWFVYSSGREIEGGTRLYEQVRNVMFKYWQERRWSSVIISRHDWMNRV